MNLRDHLSLDISAAQPIYRQVADGIRQAIGSGILRQGMRLPATRELAGQLGLNRTTVSAAYAVLEEAGLLEGQVGRGSFVAGSQASPLNSLSPNWEALLGAGQEDIAPSKTPAINFATSRPADNCFPLAEFRRLSRDVIEGPDAPEILQLGSPYGYGPLRRYLLSQGEESGWVNPGDDLIVTSGCQQALDLLARIFVREGAPVLVEDPVYHGLLRVFERAGANLLPVPVTERGIDLEALGTAIERHRPRLLVVTPEFQNPTGATLSLDRRTSLIELTERFGLVIIESDVYRKLRYTGQSLPSLKQLDRNGRVISIGSYSKIAFPGLRVGWVVAPRPVVSRLAEAKQTSDLHSDQLSQAVLLRFAESGELARHLTATRREGLERLRSALDSCRRFLPAGATFTRPEGGMNLWIELPAPLLAESLLAAVEERGVSFLPGRFFSTRREHRRGLRISFGGLSPQAIAEGIEIIGESAEGLLASHQSRRTPEPVAALV